MLAITLLLAAPNVVVPPASATVIEQPAATPVQPTATPTQPAPAPAQSAAEPAQPAPGPVQPVAAPQDELSDTLPDPAAPANAAPAEVTAPAAASDAAPPAPDNAATAPSAEPAPSDAASSTEPLPELDLDNAGLAKDPLQGFNRISFDVSQVIDKIVIRPAAMVYRHVVPKPGRDGIHNVLTNLGEPIVFINDIMQLRPKRVLHTLGRFLINSTLGLGGLFDVAKRKPFHLEHHANSFGDTLGYYGVKPGPYIYIPVFGPTTLRDIVGNAESMIPPRVLPQIYNRSDLSLVSTITAGLDQRERADDDLKAMKSDAIDYYATFRANYLQDRAGEIAALKAHDGKPAATSPFDDPLTDPAAASPPAKDAKPSH